MIDLLIDARMAHFSGIGTYIRELLPYFRKSFLRVTLLVDELENEWCRGFDQIVLNAPIYSIREQLLYPFKIPNVDVFFSPHYNVPFFPIQAKKKIVTIHDVCHLVFGSRLQKMYAKTMLKKAVQFDRIITVSHFSKSEIEKHLHFSRAEVIPIAANLRQFYQRPISDLVRKKYQLPEKFFLFIGNQKPHKNLEGLKQAFLKANLSGVGLVIAGKENPFGMIDDVDLPFIYSMAEAFIFPSFYEGFGLPPLEAMACGCPTLVSKRASIPEVCGDASLYFNPESIDDMAVSMRRIMSDFQLREELIAKGLEKAASYSWKSAAEKHIALFSEVVSA